MENAEEWASGRISRQEYDARIRALRLREDAPSPPVELGRPRPTEWVEARLQRIIDGGGVHAAEAQKRLGEIQRIREEITELDELATGATAYVQATRRAATIRERRRWGSEHRQSKTSRRKGGADWCKSRTNGADCYQSRAIGIGWCKSKASGPGGCKAPDHRRGQREVCGDSSGDSCARGIVHRGSIAAHGTFRRHFSYGRRCQGLHGSVGHYQTRKYAKRICGRPRIQSAPDFHLKRFRTSLSDVQPPAARALSLQVQ